MPIDNIAHNVEEYFVGKGIVTIKPIGDDDWFDAGNVPELEFTPNIEELAHLSARAGTRIRDRTVIIEKGGDLRIVLEEWTAQNMAIILLGDTVVIPGSAGPPVTPDLIKIDMMARNAFSAAVRFQGQNDVGAKWNFEFLRVDFVPSGSLNPISEEWGSMEITGRLAAVEVAPGVLKFGRARRMSDGTTPGWFVPADVDVTAIITETDSAQTNIALNTGPGDTAALVDLDQAIALVEAIDDANTAPIIDKLNSAKANVALNTGPGDTAANADINAAETLLNALQTYQ